MRAKTPRILLAAACAVGFAGGALAAETAQQRLESAEKRLAAQADATKGAAQQELRLQKERIDGLIRRMESGQPVSSSEVEDALRRANTMPY